MLYLRHFALHNLSRCVISNWLVKLLTMRCWEQDAGEVAGVKLSFRPCILLVSCRLAQLQLVFQGRMASCC